MNSAYCRLLAIGVAYITLASQAVVRYVDVNSTNATPPFINWSSAAATIQDAVDAADAGDEILVTNGVYQTGGRAVQGTLTNRVAMDKTITVRSVNGPQFTIIQGRQVPGTVNGDAAIRCVYLDNGAILSGFTLTNGATRPYPSSSYSDQHGGGVMCGNALVTNCIITGNSASFYGGGVSGGTLSRCTLSSNLAFAGGGAAWAKLNGCVITGNSAANGAGVNGGTLNNCTLYGNSASQSSGANEGGGANNATLNNCTVALNSAGSGGGVWSCQLTNCIVYFNSGANHVSSTMSYCCTTPDPGGVGNVTLDPQLASATYLSAGSPCRGAGSAAYAVGVDIDGEPWRDPPSLGCDEYYTGAVTGVLTSRIVATYTNVAANYPVDFMALIEGRVLSSAWDFGDGLVVTNRPLATHAWTTAGDYVVRLRAYNESNSEGVSSTVTVRVEAGTHYVAAASTNPLPPYTNWATAAVTIQQAIDVAITGDEIVVTNGIYATGGRAVSGTMTNRVAVDKPITIRSVNGPQFTVIRGYQIPGLTNGDEAVRCVYLTDGASLIGFTITNGATRWVSSDPTFAEASGGGLWCESWNAVISNCVVTGNSAFGSGGGVYSGTLYNCRLEGNVANGLRLSQLGGGGGGVYWSRLYNCTVSGNRSGLGGGAYYGNLNNSIVINNSASNHGGGGFASGFRNCTVTGNSATQAGGASECNVYNSIVYYNSAQEFPDQGSCYTVNSCTSEVGSSVFGNIGNITNPPQFGGDLRLLPNSPCINSGNNADASGATDFEGKPRIVGGTVDIGAFEFQTPSSLISYAWLQQYGLTINGSTDSADPDGDGMNNWQEWRADTIPNNTSSALRMLSSTGNVSGVSVSWESVSTRSYWLERATNLSAQPAFSTIATNLPGQAGIRTYTDTTAFGSGLFFYRVGVQP